MSQHDEPHVYTCSCTICRPATTTVDALLVEVQELTNALLARQALERGFKGMGVNIMQENAARVPSQVRRVLREFDLLRQLKAGTKT